MKNVSKGFLHTKTNESLYFDQLNIAESTVESLIVKTQLSVQSGRIVCHCHYRFIFAHRDAVK